MQYMYCPRFVYYMHVLNIEQREHKRALVNKGRDIHELKMVTNKDYLRKKIGATDKHKDVYLSSKELKLVGKIDEVLILSDNSAAPLDYKYAFWENRIFKTYKMQQTLYALLIEENFERQVNKAFLVYVRSKNHLVSIDIDQSMKDKASQILEKIFQIINHGKYPKQTGSHAQCIDCTYRNICAV